MMYGLVKLAALNEDIKLYPHQERAVNKLGNAVVLAHSVGSGKTLSGIARFEKLKEDGEAEKALVVVPAGLRDNFGREGVEKFTNSTYNIIGNKQEMKKGGNYGPVNPDADYNIISYDIFRRDPERYLRESGADTFILDENHKTKNERTATTEAFKKLKGQYKNFIGLTGSVVSNSISDIQPLVDIASGGSHNLGKNKQEFETTYLKRNNGKAYRHLHEKRKPVIGFKHEKELKKELSQYVDYVDYDDIKELANMPGKNISVERVPISKEQTKLYKGLLNENPNVKKMILNKRLETMRDEEAAKAFSSLIESRKLMNSVGAVKPNVSLSESAEQSPKTKKLLDDLVEHLNSTRFHLFHFLWIIVRVQYPFPRCIV